MHLSRKYGTPVLAALLLSGSVAALPTGALAQGPGGPGGGAPGGGPGGPRPGGAPRTGPRPYDEVITKEAKTDEGLFKVHRIDDRVYYEIPAKLLGQELLWVINVAKVRTAYDPPRMEVQDLVVKWTRRGNQLLLRAVDYQLRADKEGAIQKAVANWNVEPIIQALPIAAIGPNDAPVVEVTSLFTQDVPEFSARRALGASRIDPSRSFIEKVKSFPQNIETRVTATYLPAPAAPTAGQFPRPGRTEGPRKDTTIEAITTEIHHSMVLLPEKPMKPRLADSRVGFFSGSFYDLNSDDHRLAERSYVRRWRLEKKDPSAAVSEPVKPIVYYVGREVPEKWRSYVKKGIEDWQVAFEAAGFKNAIIAKDAPTEAEDPDWDAEDMRHSVIRWLPSATENAYGPHIADPRTGEILDADVKIFHNILKLNEEWYFTQASPNDSRAQKLPLPDDLMGDLMRYVVSHEVGHTLGLMHNMKASSAYTVAQLRNAEFTNKMGTEASIMDYGRFNYVAQPGDNARLIPLIGPYDKFAIEWGYKELADAKTPDEEKPELDRIAARQVKDPTLRFGNADPSEDPGRQTEDLGSDGVAATELGLKNLRRVLGYLMDATCKPGEDYDRLEEMYRGVISQRNRELMHVTAMVGGVVQTDYHYGRGDVVYSPVPAEKQRQAVQFLVANALATPKELLRPEILNRIESGGTADRILTSQTSILNTLMSETRIKRMTEQNALAGGKGYSPLQLMDDLRRGVWSELSAPAVTIDSYRRNLQRAYLQSLGAKIAPGAATGSDLRALSRSSLVALKDALPVAILRAGDPESKVHLQDALETVKQLLDPTK